MMFKSFLLSGFIFVGFFEEGRTKNLQQKTAHLEIKQNECERYPSRKQEKKILFLLAKFQKRAPNKMKHFGIYFIVLSALNRLEITK